jgi:hypothetical protein
MSDKFKSAFNVPIQIPVWGVATALVGAIFWGGYYGGNMLAKMETMVELLRDTKLKADATQAQVERINERQIRGLAQLAEHDQTIRTHESRLAAIEARSKK